MKSVSYLAVALLLLNGCGYFETRVIKKNYLESCSATMTAKLPNSDAKKNEAFCGCVYEQTAKMYDSKTAWFSALKNLEQQPDDPNFAAKTNHAAAICQSKQ